MSKDSKRFIDRLTANKELKSGEQVDIKHLTPADFDLHVQSANVDFEGTEGGVVSATSGTAYDTTNDNFRDALLEACGLDPERWTIIGRVRTSAWQQKQGGEFLHSYRVHVEPINEEHASIIDPDALMHILESLPREEPIKKSVGDEYWAVFHVADLQLGKADGGGSEHIVNTYMERLNSFVAWLQAMSTIRNIAGVQICMPGDCVEGNMSQSGRNTGMASLDLSLTDQVRVLSRLMNITVAKMCDLVPKVYLDVVNGNHDEAQRMPSTTSGDGWAVLAAKMLDGFKADGLADGRLDNLEVRYPKDNRAWLVAKVGDTNVVVTHGHHIKPGGANQVLEWWTKMVGHGQMPHVGVLQFGHFHQPMLRSEGVYIDQECVGSRTAICADTYEGESTWFYNSTGKRSANVGTAYLLSNNRVECYTQI